MNDKKKVTGIIQIYSKKAREQISDVGTHFFDSAGIIHIANDVFSCVDELIKNAVKANYKFILIIDRIRANILKSNKSEEDAKKIILDILHNKDSYDKYAYDILNKEDISDIVRNILNEESKYLRIKNKVYDEHRDYTREEKDIINGLKNFMNIRNEIKKFDIKILLKIEMDSDFIFIEITNTVPIMSNDLNRIYKKRDEYKSYRLKGKEHEFFINNIDTSDSAFGLGYAKIDSFLAEMGLDPDGAITIISASSTTAMLTLPLKVLRRLQTTSL